MDHRNTSVQSCKHPARGMAAPGNCNTAPCGPVDDRRVTETHISPTSGFLLSRKYSGGLGAEPPSRKVRYPRQSPLCRTARADKYRHSCRSNQSPDHSGSTGSELCPSGLAPRQPYAVDRGLKHAATRLGPHAWRVSQTIRTRADRCRLYRVCSRRRLNRYPERPMPVR